MLSSPPRRWLLILLAVAVLGAQLGGAHVHLCIDGSEPPASMHYEDDVGAHHGERGAPADVGDVDISLPGDLILRASTFGLDFPLALLSILLPWLPSRALTRCVAAPYRAPATTPACCRPPPARGPPLPISR